MSNAKHAAVDLDPAGMVPQMHDRAPRFRTVERLPVAAPPSIATIARRAVAFARRNRAAARDLPAGALGAARAEVWLAVGRDPTREEEAAIREAIARELGGA